jgi:serine/threonine protein kinase
VHFQVNQEIAQRYLYKGPLGRGAHGIVCRVYDSVRDGEVALKLFHDDAFDVQTAEAARQFQVAEGICILPLLEVHTAIAEGQATVMPVAAGTLAETVPTFASHAVYATRRILTALEFCHGRRVIHGDVKPSNAFRDVHGNVLLGDFGVAGMTPEYAAPELLQTGDKSVATDLWAVAVSFYELLCGEPPFGERPNLDEYELAQRVQACDYTHPDDRLPHLPLRFRQFFRHAFTPNPQERAYTSAATMRHALRDLAVRVEWAKLKKHGCVVCFEGYELTSDGHRNGTTYEASIVERPRRGDFVPVVKKAPADQGLRRLTGLPAFSGSKLQAAQQLSVWMRRLTDSGDYRG